jgi:dihydroorotase
MTRVHFREPGLTHKASIHTEARAAVAGGVTSFFEMPNVSPPTLDMERLEEKRAIARRESVANYAFFLGASNENLEAVKSATPAVLPESKYLWGHPPEICWLMRRPLLNKSFAMPQLP